MDKIDKNYWRTQIPHPYSPSEEDIEIFSENKTTGNTLLLGCTHDLIPLSDYQMDIDPWYDAPSVIIQDWRTNTVNYANMIGDGVLNLTEELAASVLQMAQKHTIKLIIRSFNYKLPIMKIANNFPKENDLPIKPNKTIKFADYSFFIWDFSK